MTSRLQTSLLLNTVQRAERQVIARFARNSDTTRLARVLELAMTSTRCDQVPAIGKELGFTTHAQRLFPGLQRGGHLCKAMRQEVRWLDCDAPPLELDLDYYLGRIDSAYSEGM
jgi:hypothetical protein